MIADENWLDERLGQLENAADWSPRTLSRFESFIRTADDFALFKVDPLEYARERNLPPREAVDLFLHATRLGLFDIQWGLVCPMCGDTVSSFATLRKVDTHFHCSLCELDTVAALDDYIMISFLISPRVRRISFHDPESLGLLDYWQKYRFNRQWRLKNGVPVTEMFSSALKGLQGLAPLETAEAAFDLPPGVLKVFNLTDERMFTLPVEADSAAAEATITWHADGAACTCDHLGSGHRTLHFHNPTARPLSLAIAHLPGDPSAGLI